jgi:hypothetical protein
MQLPQDGRAPEAWLRQHWSQMWALALTAPAALVVMEMSLPVAAAALLVCFFVASVTALAMTAYSLRTLSIQVPAAVRFGVGAAATALGLGGLLAHSALAGSAAVAAYLTTAVWANLSRGTATGEQRSASHGPEPLAQAPHLISAHELAGMSDAELCLAWRRSHVSLMSATDPGRRAEVVLMRQWMLDEMDARCPVGLRAWLHSGARADGPDRFLGRGAQEDPREAA